MKKGIPRKESDGIPNEWENLGVDMCGYRRFRMYYYTSYCH
jgi:hypothetical protein